MVCSHVVAVAVFRMALLPALLPNLDAHLLVTATHTSAGIMGFCSMRCIF